MLFMEPEVHTSQSLDPLLYQINSYLHIHISLRALFYSIQSIDLSSVVHTSLPTEILFTYPTSPVRATLTAHLIPLDLNILSTFTQQSKLLNFLLRKFFFCFLDPNIVLRVLFSDIPSLCCSFNVKVQVSHTYKQIKFYSK
jgi:hypothetical protein